MSNNNILLRHIKDTNIDLPEVQEVDELVCCKDDLDKAIEKVKSVDGPNVVYCKDENKIYYHRKERVSRMRKALEMDDPYGDVPKFIMQCMTKAEQYYPDTIPEIVRL